MAAPNIHGTALLIGHRGLLITGAPGVGKTTLALALLDHFAARGVFARLVADDQLFVSGHGGRLVCRAPDTIAGLVEVPGFGPRPMPFEPAAVVDLAIRLVPVSEMARFQEEGRETIAGCAVPRLDLVERNAGAALPAVAARFGLAPFV
jgi:serine kinase of HPr protein (carbohydrate metabolism regulator)